MLSYAKEVSMNGEIPKQSLYNRAVFTTVATERPEP
jgi:hypothetical protein